MIWYDMDLLKAGYIDSVKRQESTSVDHKNCRIYVPSWTLGPPAWVELDWLFNVTINDISVIYVTAHRCAGGLKKKLDLRSGSHAIDIS